MNVGKIIGVEYNQFNVQLYQSTKITPIIYDSHIYYFGNIGSLLKTKNTKGDYVICEVVAIIEQASQIIDSSKYNLDSSRLLTIKPIGTLFKDSHFAMGINLFPALYSDVTIVTVNELDQIINLKNIDKEGEEEKEIHRFIELGYSKNMIDYKINLNINSFFNIHTAILGNSGSGKSNTITHILQEVYKKKDYYAIGAKTIIFDVNGEYQTAFTKTNNPQISCKIYKPNSNQEEEINTNPFYLPYYLLTLDEWLAFLMASERTQKPFWDKVLQESYRFFKMFKEEVDSKYTNYFKWKIINIIHNIITKTDNDTSKITAIHGVILKSRSIIEQLKPNNELLTFLDKLVSKCSITFGKNDNQLSDFITKVSIDNKSAQEVNEQKLPNGQYFDYKYLKVATEIVLLEEEAKGNSLIREFTSTMIARLEHFIENTECNFMRDKTAIDYSNSNDYISSTFNIDDKLNANQLIIIDISEISSDILELTTNAISRMIFEYKRQKTGHTRREQPIHLILDEAHRYISINTQYMLKENIFERIAREGRKYAMYLIVSSQRPSELSSTVLSQCGNYIIHRIQNEMDMKYIYSVLPYFSDDYISKIKQSTPGEALVFGNCVPIPLQVKIHQADPEPNSKNCDISAEWFKERI